MKPTPWTAQGTHLLEDTHLCQCQLFRWTAYFVKLKGLNKVTRNSQKDITYLNSGFPCLSLYQRTRLTLSSGFDGVMLQGKLVSIPLTLDTWVTGTGKKWIQITVKK